MDLTAVQRSLGTGLLTNLNAIRLSVHSSPFCLIPYGPTSEFSLFTLSSALFVLDATLGQGRPFSTCGGNVLQIATLMMSL